MNLKKYNQWNKYINRSKDKREAYRVFSYWLKIKQSFNFNINFSLEPIELKRKLYTEYQKELVLFSLTKISKKYNINISDDLPYLFLKEVKHISGTKTELFKLFDSLLLNNKSILPKFESTITKSLTTFKNYFSNYKLDHFLNFLEINNIKFEKIFHNNKTIIMPIIKNNKDLLLLSSPSWCILYSEKELEKQNEKYENLIFYVYKDNIKEDIFGHVFLKRTHINSSCFNQNNEIILDKEKDNLLNLLLCKKDFDYLKIYINEIFKYKYNSYLFLLLNQGLNKKDILYICNQLFLKTNISKFKFFNSNINFIVSLKNEKILNYLFETFNESDFLLEYINHFIIDYNKNINFHKLEIKNIIKYIYNKNDSKLLHKFFQIIYRNNEKSFINYNYTEANNSSFYYRLIIKEFYFENIKYSLQELNDIYNYIINEKKHELLIQFKKLLIENYNDDFFILLEKIKNILNYNDFIEFFKNNKLNNSNIKLFDNPNISENEFSSLIFEQIKNNNFSFDIIKKLNSKFILKNLDKFYNVSKVDSRFLHFIDFKTDPKKEYIKYLDIFSTKYIFNYLDKIIKITDNIYDFKYIFDKKTLSSNQIFQFISISNCDFKDFYFIFNYLDEKTLLNYSLTYSDYFIKKNKNLYSILLEIIYNKDIFLDYYYKFDLIKEYLLYTKILDDPHKFYNFIQSIKNLKYFYLIKEQLILLFSKHHGSYFIYNLKILLKFNK